MSTPVRDLVLYKRTHIPTCVVHTLKNVDPQTWWGCTDTCLIWIYGRLPNGEKLPRTTTGETDIKKAEAVRAAYKSSALAEVDHGKLIKTCTEKFMEFKKTAVSDRTNEYYQRALDLFVAHCAAEYVHHMNDLTPNLLRSFQAKVPPGEASRVRVFLKYAYKDEDWTLTPLYLKLNPSATAWAVKKKSATGGADGVVDDSGGEFKVDDDWQKINPPFEEQEVMQILDGVLKLKERRKLKPTPGFTKFPKTTRLLIELMLETLMRVGDACLFNPAKVTKRTDSQWMYQFWMQKTPENKAPKLVDVFISDSLWQAILQAKEDGEWYGVNRPFAFPHKKNKYYYGQRAYAMMKAIGKACGIADCRPHRLRDTGAVALLEGSNRACTRSGPPPAPVPIEHVSKLLAHSSVKITEQYYAFWSPGRSKVLGAHLDAGPSSK